MKIIMSKSILIAFVIGFAITVLAHIIFSIILLFIIHQLNAIGPSAKVDEFAGLIMIIIGISFTVMFFVSILIGIFSGTLIYKRLNKVKM